MRDQSADKVFISCKGKDQKQHNPSATELVKKKKKKKKKKEVCYLFCDLNFQVVVYHFYIWCYSPLSSRLTALSSQVNLDNLISDCNFLYFYSTF